MTTYPHTAPPLEISSTESSFSFDPPASPRSARVAEKSPIKFTFDGGEESYLTINNKENILRRMSHDVSNSNKRRTANRLENAKDRQTKGKETTTMSMSEIKKISSTRKMSSVSQSSTSTGTSSELTTFPFDREAIDYERIQRECFAVEEEFDDGFVTAPHHSVFHYDYDTDSPSYEALDQKVPPSEGIFQQYAYLSQLEREKQTMSELKTLSGSSKMEQSKVRKWNETSTFINAQDHQPPASSASALNSPIPDLKIDYFSEVAAKSSTKVLENANNVDSNRKHDHDDVGNDNEVFAGENADAALERCQKDQLGVTSSFSKSSSNSINVTSNPMSTAVVTTPRATIVVQQVNEKTFFLLFFLEERKSLVFM